MGKILYAGGNIPGVVPGVGVQVVHIDPCTVGDTRTHEREPFRREAIATVQVAVVPCDAVEIDEVKVGERVEARTNCSTAGGSGTISMRVTCVERCMVVEVFLDVNDVVWL